MIPNAFAESKPTRSFLAADGSKKILALIGEDGTIEWKTKTDRIHDLHKLESGNILFQTDWTKIKEVNPKTDVVEWKYDASTMNGNKGKKLEVHAFQPLANDKIMIVESGVSRILEVDSLGNISHQIQFKLDAPSPHRDTRLVRKLDSGNYLVAHEGLGAVYEYDPQGKVVWSYEIPLFDKPRKKGHGLKAFGNQCFAAIRLGNGNTLISTGNGHSVLEVSPEREIVWSLTQDELPGIQLAWVTTLQILPSGNIVIGNCHAGPDNPQLIEITRNKKVVWTYLDFKTFGNALSNSQILSVDGQPIPLDQMIR